MERLILVLLLTVGLLVSCTPQDQQKYGAWEADFANRPAGFDRAVTALWIASYQEDPETRKFTRSTAWGEVNEKLVPDGEGGYTVAVPLLLQGETSDGPLSDRFWTVMVRVVKDGERFSLVPNEALPGEVAGWHDDGRRTVWFRGKAPAPGGSTLWQFQGRY